MNLTSIQNVKTKAYQAGRQFNQAVQKYWLRAIFMGIAFYLIYEKDLAIDLQLSNIPAAAIQLGSIAEPPAIVRAQPAALTVTHPEAEPGHQPTAPLPASYEAQAVNVSNLANTYSNLSNSQKGLPDSENEALRAEKRRKQLKYIKRYVKVAQTEMEKYGIPASITIAQGLLESNVGESKLATRNNNHFGIKCFSRSCKKGHCSNFTDDSHKDFFRMYKSSWESYRAHSLLLKRSDRYSSLFPLGTKDYRGWAHGLTKAGYATDKQYGNKLVKLIEELNLHQYDQ